jgi:RNA polymerase sigma factor (sigma-70 family)
MASKSPHDPDLKAYLSEIGKAPLLDAERERELGRQVQAGSQTARDLYIEANLRLVVHVARKWSRSGIPLSDLIEEGNLGLIRAVEKYDPDAGCRFSTYAMWWIRQAIGRAVQMQGRAVRVPPSMQEKVNRWERTRRELEEQLGRSPMPGEIAHELSITKRTTRNIKMAIDASRMTFSSLSVDEDGAGWSETLVDDQALQPLEHARSVEDAGRVNRCLDVLDERSRWVIARRYGLDGEEPQTLEEIGALLGVSRERVRQIARRALTTLRAELAGSRAEAA